MAGCGSAPREAGHAASSDTSDAASSASPDVAAPPSTGDVVAASSDPAPTSTAVAELSPYPDAAIHRGATDAEKRCTNVAYKGGCDPKSGELTVRVTLRDDGSVLSIHRVKNALKNDSQAVEQCALDALQAFQFDAPAGAASSFTVKLSWEKC